VVPNLKRTHLVSETTPSDRQHRQAEYLPKEGSSSETDIVLERLTSILCVSFARGLRIFEAVASTEDYQTFLLPKFNVVAEPAIRSRLKVEVFVYEIVATLALPVQSAFDWCPYYCHI
jgi:hypothetical protein